jgi:hypothetical protein
MWHGIKWHAQQGFSFLDFGRTSLQNEGLRRFKLSWGAKEFRINYARVDIASGRYVISEDRSNGWHNRFFRMMPMPVSRLIGQLLYPHVA